MSAPATTRFDDSNIISEHGTMAVTYQGMAHLEQYFFIDRDELWEVEYETFSHMYPWIDEEDFDAALAAAKSYHVSRTNAEEQAVERDRQERKERHQNSYAFIDSYNGAGTLLISIVDEDENVQEDVDITLADSESSITYSENLTSDEDGQIFVKGLELLADNADATYVATFTSVPEGYKTPSPLSIEVVHGTITRKTVTLEAEEIEE